MAISRGLKYLVGVVLSLNFVAYWAVPVAGMGMIYKYVLSYVGRPLFEMLDNVPLMRSFAAKYIYQKEQFNDFFLMSLLTAVSICTAFGIVLRSQMLHGTVPWSLVFAYYCTWVGLGGRSMGTAYTMAHKEGHNVMIYQKWWRRAIGNLFENRLGVLYGNVPYNFQVSSRTHAATWGSAKRARRSAPWHGHAVHHIRARNSALSALASASDALDLHHASHRSGKQGQALV